SPCIITFCKVLQSLRELLPALSFLIGKSRIKKNFCSSRRLKISRRISDHQHMVLFIAFVQKFPQTVFLSPCFLGHKEICILSQFKELPLFVYFLKISRCNYDDICIFSGHPQCILCTIKRRFFRSEEHTSELQSRFDLVCRLLLEKKKQ